MVGYSLWGRQESDTTEQLHCHWYHERSEPGSLNSPSFILQWVPVPLGHRTQVSIYRAPLLQRFPSPWAQLFPVPLPFEFSDTFSESNEVQPTSLHRYNSFLKNTRLVGLPSGYDYMCLLQRGGGGGWDAGLIPNQVTKIPHAAWYNQKKF